MKRIGIYPGSFDPIHEGHIAFARQAMSGCGLDSVTFMPEALPRGKPNVSPIEIRMSKISSQLSDTPFKVIRMQSDKFTTSRTLSEIKEIYNDTSLTLLLGADAALKLQNWPRVDKIISNFHIAIGMRDGYSESLIKNTLGDLDARFTIIKTDLPHLSSTLIRDSH